MKRGAGGGRGGQGGGQSGGNRAVVVWGGFRVWGVGKTEARGGDGVAWGRESGMMLSRMRSGCVCEEGATLECRRATSEFIPTPGANRPIAGNEPEPADGRQHLEIDQRLERDSGRPFTPYRPRECLRRRR